MSGTRVNHAIILIFDNVRAEHLFGWLAAGKLPHIERLARDGLTCRRCVTAFPSITYPTQSDILTGSYSGYWPKEGSGIPTYHWFNRTDPPSTDPDAVWYRSYAEGLSYLKMNKDLGPNCQTVFEQAGDGNFLASFHPCNRGALWYPPKLRFGLLMLWNVLIRHNFPAIDAKVVRYIGRAFERPRKFFDTNEAPRVSATVLPGPDALLHNKGYDHPAYINHVLGLDAVVGDLVATLDRTGHADDTVVAIIADHGNYKASETIDLEPLFARQGLRPFDKKRRAGDFDATAGSVGFFNFRGQTWHHHPTRAELERFSPSGTGTGAKTLDVFEFLRALPGTRALYYPDDANTADRGVVHVERWLPGHEKPATARIEFAGHGREQRVKYTWDAEEVFGYAEHEACALVLDGKPHDVTEWLAATHATDFPFLVDQLPRYFKNPRAADVVTSSLGHTLYAYEHGETKEIKAPYSHDIGAPRSMLVPLILGGADALPRGDVPFCKIGDLVPTVLDLLGETPHASVVGTSLLDAL